MTRVPKRPEDILPGFAADVEKVYGEDLVSIILFGSGARGEYVPKKSDLNFLIVVRDNTPSELSKFQAKLHKWRKSNVATPLFLTEEYIRSSLDTFPIEFLDMKSAYKLVKGKDILAGLELSKRDLRLQCERELKGKMLHLRQAFLESRGKVKNLPGLVSSSMAGFAPIFKALLYILGVEPPSKRADLLRKICQSFDLNYELFDDLLQIGRREKKVSASEINYLFDKYVEEIDRLSEKVDALSIEEEGGR
ncbi:MAG TPA: hypothetical protein EYP53_03605 [Candidatus Latescibacteria bacterium]|nr:hypothetical protein [Candidatus Latescibacterota bacterium]